MSERGITNCYQLNCLTSCLKYVDMNQLRFEDTISRTQDNIAAFMPLEGVRSRFTAATFSFYFTAE